MQTEQGSDEGEALKADPNCILHIGKDKSCEKVKLFSVPLLEKCREKSLVYKFRENSEYANITIPEKVDIVLQDIIHHATKNLQQFQQNRSRKQLINKVHLTSNVFHLQTQVKNSKIQVIIK